MKKQLKFKGLLSRFKKRRAVVTAGVFVAGLAIGTVAGIAIGKYEPPRNSTKVTPLTKQERANRIVESRKQSIAMALQKVSDDEKAGKITKEKADKLKTKITQIGADLAKLDVNATGYQRSLQDMRRQWLTWARDNDIPSIYFIRIS